MTSNAELRAARRRFAETLRQTGVRSALLLDAFASVPRERFLGPGPWSLLASPPRGYETTADADPVHLYRDVAVGIDPSRLLNNGQPSFVAGLADALDPRPGEHVVHVGAGTGYYTAILAHAVGPAGRVTAIEIDAALAGRAAANLADWPQVRLVNADGGSHDPGPANAYFVSAGATHIPPLWLDRLESGGRLLLPLVRWPAAADERSAAGTGIVLRVERHQRDYSARLVCSCMFFPCIGAIDAEADRDLAAALSRLDEADRVHRLRRDAHARDAGCWLHGRGFCLSLG
jgi:protein-L-isoaspartate(D-aspartate) O-methyltransferase